MKFARAAAPAGHQRALPNGQGVWASHPGSIVGGLTSEGMLVFLLIFSVFLDTLRLPVEGGLFNLRPSFVVFAAVFPVLVYRWVVRRERIEQTPLLPVLLVFDGLFFFSTLINPDAPYHLRGLISGLLLL